MFAQVKVVHIHRFRENICCFNSDVTKSGDETQGGQPTSEGQEPQEGTEAVQEEETTQEQGEGGYMFILMK